MVFPDEGIKREAFHQPVELGGSEFSGFRRIARPGEMSAFNPFCKKEKPIHFPKKPFDPAGTSATEEKQGVGNEKREIIPLLNDSNKGIDAIAHIGAATDYIDSGKRGRISIPKHGAEPG